MLDGCVWAAAPAESGLPPAWQTAWQRPAAELRPMQIVHRLEPKRATPDGMRAYEELGLGGIVTNVPFDKYLENEAGWKTLTDALDACRQRGQVVWIYDEEGYPSGAAGGLVLRESKQYEALALAYDAGRPDPFILRPAFEHTHASNNYAAVRRYINLLDPDATACFLRVTHDAYFKHLGPHFGKTIVATFTDEPSLMALNLGQLPETVRGKVRVADPIDPSVAALPCVPWSRDLPDVYRQRYARDLLSERKSLFVGESDEDRAVRRRYWSLVADLVAERYYGQIQRWCRAHGIASSGHKLAEESLLSHVPLDGNGLKVLTRMDIPGLDLLTSNPEAVISSGWLTAGMPCSAAMLEGRRRVMTEVSDFSQKMGGQGPVGLAEMQATAAWQAACGVTEFTLYYGSGDRPPADTRAYGEFVGRLNAILRPAELTNEVLLYYPIHDLWAEYRPVAEPIKLTSQSARAQQIVGSFMRLGRVLTQNQVPLCLVDHEHLSAAQPTADGGLRIGPRRYSALVLPQGVELPPEAAKVVEQFRAQGGRVLIDTPEKPLDGPQLLAALKPRYRLQPAGPKICLGTFTRDGRDIVLAVNVGKEPYQGGLVAADAGRWTRLDPASGSQASIAPASDGALPLALAPRATALLIRSP